VFALNVLNNRATDVASTARNFDTEMLAVTGT